MLAVRPLTTAAAAAALLAALAAGPVPAASAAPVASGAWHPRPVETMTLYATVTERNVVDVGTSGGSIGDIVSGSGDVRMSRQGRVVGSYVYSAEVVRDQLPGGREQRLTVISYSLAGGTIMTQALFDVPTGAVPDRRIDHVVIGGTGSYAFASGTAVATVLSRSPYSYRLKLRLRR